MRYKAAETFGLALMGALLHKATAWLGAGALTWATVVLMGGFSSEVPISDFVWITGLVLIIVCLLALARFSCKLVTKTTLFKGSVNPAHFTYNDKRPMVVTIIELIFCFLQLFLLFPCLWKGITSIRRPDFQFIHSYFYKRKSDLAVNSSASSNYASLQACLQTCLSTANSSFSSTNHNILATCAQSCLPTANSNSNLQVCLFAFFLLVILTSSSAALCLLHTLVVKPVFWRLYFGSNKSLSMMRYYGEVLSRALNVGLVEADEFDARKFMLRGLGEDLVMRNIGPLEVKRQNADFIKYLYNHPQGVEMVYEGLASEDTLLQQTAANMVGFSATEERLDSHTALLCRLGEKLGLTGKAAEGAANSFSALAVAWKDKNPCPLLNVRVPRDSGSTSRCVGSTVGACNVVDRVVDLVLQRWAPTVLVYLRALDSFFMSACIRSYVSQHHQHKVEEKLLKIIDKDKDRQESGTRTKPRSRLIAFSALYRLKLMSAEQNSEDVLDVQKESMEKEKERMKKLLELLDGELSTQEFMWVEEAERYKQLCKDLGKRPGAWLGTCDIKGRNLLSII